MAGLSWSLGAMNAMHGVISVESEGLEKGAIVHLLMPAAGQGGGKQSTRDM